MLMNKIDNHAMHTEEVNNPIFLKTINESLQENKRTNSSNNVENNTAAQRKKLENYFFVFSEQFTYSKQPYIHHKIHNTGNLIEYLVSKIAFTQYESDIEEQQILQTSVKAVKAWCKLAYTISYTDNNDSKPWLLIYDI